MKMKIVAIIPARGGSKGIPEKNLALINGKPLIAWSIEHAISSSLIDEVWVSSDSEKILRFSESIGAKIIKRPADISGDEASSESAWIHAIENIQEDDDVELVVAMQATSPIRNKNDLDNAIIKYKENRLDSLFSSNILDDMNYWCVDKNNKLYSANYDYKDRKRRQDVNEKFLENGSFYIFTPQGILHSKNRLHGNIGCYVMEKRTMFQIDEKEDMGICESIMRYFN
jgi:CMP-N,N'-diacetyllegionaminic acid synthase